MAVNNKVKFYTISAANFPATYTSANFPDDYKGIFVHLTDDKTDGTGENANVIYKKGLYFGGNSGWEYLTNDLDSATITAMQTKLNGIEDGANKYIHPAVNHIPTGGSSGQFLGWDSTGKAKWVNNPNTNTTYTIATGDANGQIKVTPSSGTAYNVDVKGLGNAAYKGSTNNVTADSTDLVESGAVKTYVDGKLTSASYYLGTITQKSGLSTTAKKGDFYRVSGATASNWSGVSDVHVGDIIIAEKDNPTASVDGTNWSLLHNELNTDTDTKVTSVGNHYSPTATAADKLDKDASSTTKATWGSTSLVTGVTIERDAAGHVTNMTLDSIQMPANPNTDSVTTVTGSDGTTTGVKVTATDNGTNSNHAYTITSEMVWLSSLPTPTA